MQKAFILSVLLFSFSLSFAQFSTEQVHIRLGYNLHNVHAKRFNHLIDAFNNSRYPHEIEENLSNLNWMHGFLLGGNYAFREDMEIVAVLKSRRQFIEATYAESGMYRSYMFRQHTLELGMNMLLKEENRLSHRIGLGILFGVTGVFTDWDDEKGYAGSSDMTNIDHTNVLGLSLNYEARMELHKHVRLFVRPVAQYSLNSRVRKLTDFMDPQVKEGVVTYSGGEIEKYENGSLSGLGIEGGLLILLPEF